MPAATVRVGYLYQTVSLFFALLLGVHAYMVYYKMPKVNVPTHSVHAWCPKLQPACMHAWQCRLQQLCICVVAILGSCYMRTTKLSSLQYTMHTPS